MYNTDISVRLQKIDIIDTSKLDILYVLTSNIISSIFITNTALGINTGILEICVVFWVRYNDDLIYAVTSYKMGTFESLYDEQWMFDVGDNDEYTHAYGNKRKRYFDSISPKRPELDKLLTLNPTYYKFDYSIVEEIKDELCGIEQEFIKVWSRDCKLKQILS